ncbi:MAG: iron-containing redox enzyme family protein [Polymorphobacter sp.]
MTPFARLELRLALARPALQAQAAQLWASAPPATIYPAWLRTMHMVVRTAVPLLTAAAAAARRRDDPLCRALADYYTRHADEEAGHDRWLVADLAATGHRMQAIQPPACIAELAGAQYYWLHHHHPVTLLGHVAAMETLPPPPGFAEQLQALTGYPATAFRTIRRHAVIDIGHAADLAALIDSLPLTPAHEAAIAVSALHTIERGIDILADLEARVRKATRAPPLPGNGQ